MQSDAERTDAIAVLAEDHRRMRTLFDEFENLPPTAYVRKSKVAAQMIDLITVHAFITREVLYPRLTSLIPEIELEGLYDQHSRAEQIASDLWTMRPEDGRFADRATALIAQLRLHLGAQEDVWFPRIVDELEPATLDAIGVELVRARRRAPASPQVSG
ncbi:hemerythrin domain-containing protein [Nocardioides marmorisolisilvae]|uniref:Hemerythrin domain-containing protein n=1 Tax=Nocardioides marmorisolisilvae TaxID=1542737 RepID=A0A3N0DU59_9ACTN|nr:hemerythrin domain-containing protein [Nocardioides marmorisolisilvae]RNL79148.1 hemerythrin domain-containing protein [Nocardioides marmorisolisilvae]